MTGLVIFGTCSLATALRPPSYTAVGKLKFTLHDPTSTLTGLNKETGKLEPIVDRSNPIITEAEVMRSEPIIEDTIRKLNLSDKSGRPLSPKLFRENLKIAEVRGADILEISYSSHEADRAAAIVNTHIDSYLQRSREVERTQVVKARQFIEQQLSNIENAVRRSELALQRFRETNRIVDLEAEAKTLTETIAELGSELTATQSQLADSQAQVVGLSAKLGMGLTQAVTNTNLSQSTDLQEILRQLQQVELELVSAQAQFQPDHPNVRVLQDRRNRILLLLQNKRREITAPSVSASPTHLQMSALQQDLTREGVLLDSKRLGLSRQLDVLKKASDIYAQRSQSLPRLESEQRQLQSQLDAAQLTYNQMLQKISELRVAENQLIGNAQILAPASKPEQPNSSKLTYLGAGLLGLMGAGAMIYILERLDSSVKTMDDARELFGFSILGVIPETTQDRQLIDKKPILESPSPQGPLLRAVDPVMATAYQRLQTNLKFLSSEQSIKVIVIASSVPSEGKSTVSANLATSIAQSGRRVLVVDADMYRPSQHQIWHLTNEIGLSHLLTEPIAPSSAIKTVMPNLDVLPVGVLSHNSLAFFDSPRMTSLLAEFSEDYDYVLIDTPPLNAVTDALILGKMADGILLIARLNILDVGSARFAKGALEQSRQIVLGQVINGVTDKQEVSDYYIGIRDSEQNSRQDELVVR